MFLIHKNNPACSKLTGWEWQPRLTHALTRYVICEHGNEERRLLFMGLWVCASQSVGIVGLMVSWTISWPIMLSWYHKLWNNFNPKPFLHKFLIKSTSLVVLLWRRPRVSWEKVVIYLLSPVYTNVNFAAVFATLATRFHFTELWHHTWTCVFRLICSCLSECAGSAHPFHYSFMIVFWFV